MVGKYRYNSKDNLYILSGEDIDFEAEQVLRKYYPKGLEEPCEIPIDSIIESMNIDLVYRRLSLNKEILGGCIFDTGKVPIYDELGNKKLEIFKSNTIIINSDLADDNDIRYGSTSGHELGHYVTQGNLYLKNKNQISLFEPNIEDIAIICKREANLLDNIYDEPKKLVTKYDWMEWQANRFSSAIVVPTTTLKKYLDPYYKKYENCYSKCLLNNLSNEELEKLIVELTMKFHVSSILIINRLKSLKLLQTSGLKEVTLWE
jgi:Zn-dependent peptidase ImmA (M78 family)